MCQYHPRKGLEIKLFKFPHTTRILVRSGILGLFGIEFDEIIHL